MAVPTKYRPPGDERHASTNPERRTAVRKALAASTRDERAALKGAQVSDAAWEALPLAAMELDVHGAVQRANDAFRALSPDAVEGTRWLGTLSAPMQALLGARLAAWRDFALELQHVSGTTT